MRKLKLFFACLLMAILSIGQMWATDIVIDLDLSKAATYPSGFPTASGTKTGTYTLGGYDFSFSCNNAFYFSTSYLMIGKSSKTVSSYITFPAIEDYKLTEVNLTASSGTSTNVAASIQDGSGNVLTGGTGWAFVQSGNNTWTLTETSANTAYKVCIYKNNTNNSTYNAQVAGLKLTYTPTGTTPPPAKTLTGVTVSGAPTKTSYYVGESFDPAGLVVTGTYSDKSTAPITSGITWAYNPSQALALNQTSIGVTATVGEITSAEFNVTGLSVTEAPLAVTFDYADYKGEGASSSGANYTMVKTQVSIGDTKFYGNNSYAHFYASGVTTITPAAGVTITKMVLTASAENYNGYQSSGTVTASVGSVSHEGVVVTWTGSTDEAFTISHNKQIRWTTIVVTYQQGEAPAVAKPTISGDGNFLNTTNVTISIPEGATVYYTTDGSTPSDASTQYGTPFALNNSATVKAIAKIGSDYSEVAEKTFTKATAKTVAEALAMSATDDVYVIGYISAITEVSTEHKNATYRISDDGTTTGEMIVYRGKYLNNADFTEENKNNIHVGDKVVVRGGLVEYQSAMQLATGNYLISIEYPEVAIPTFEPATEGFLESVEVTLACSTDGAEIRYTLDGTDPTATSALYQNPFTLTETTTVKAVAIKGGTTTAVVSKTYTKQEIMTVAEALASSAANGVYVKGIISTITEVSTGYKNATYRISDNGTTTGEMIVYRGRYINNTDFTSEDQIELGDEVVVYGNLTLYNSAMQLATGNYLISLVRKADADLAWSANAVELTVGEEFNAPTLQNPNNIDAAEISIESNNIDLATVENGVVSLVENATGEATITATFAGNDQYKAAQVSYTITVNAAAPVLTDYYEKATSVVEGTYLIVYEEGSLAFNGGLETLDAKNNVIDVEITNDNKIGVTTATEAATFYIEPAAGTIQAANGKYIGVTSNSNGLKQSDNADAYENAFAIDADGNAVISAVFENANMTMRYNKASDQNRFRYFGSGQQPIALYKLANETIKDNPNLAWDKESIELTVGGVFTSPELSHAQGITGTISYVSDNENVATVENGVISLVAEATGTAHITASYAGDENYKSGSAVCTIKVNPAHSIYVNKLIVNFGSVAKDATVDAIAVAVTLTNVDAATATLSGSGASAYSIDPAALTASGTITISASTATVGTFNAKLTISDDANEAEAKEVNLKLIVTDPASEETPISTSTEWVAATEITDGMQVLITGVKDEVVYAMGEQKSTNRAAYIATVDGEGVLTPGEGTMAFTLVAQGDGTYAIRTSNGKYLYAAASGSNHLKTQDEVDVNAKWTLTIASAVAEGSSNRNIMRFNGSGTNKLFSCYSSGQEDIKFYVPKPVTPPTPVYETVRENLAANRYYTLCFNRTMEAVQGATFWAFASKDANMAYLVQQDAPYAAGTPYIIYAEAAGDLTAVLSGDVETNPGVNGALHGTFDLMDQTALDNAGENIYLLMNNQLRRVDGQLGNSLPAYRAYIDLDEIDNNGAPANVPAHRVRAIPMHKDVVTGFENLNATDKPVKLLIDGNIYILRGEKMYDATGRLVK